MATMSEKQAELYGILKSAGYLAKEAQEITHKKLDAAQPAIGDKMQSETESATKGNYASDKSVDASIKGTVEIADKKVEGDDDKKAEKVLSETGSPVDKIHPCGAPAGTPADLAVVKSAALKARIEACVKSEMAKEAAAKEAAAKAEEIKKEAAAQREEITTATEVLNKVASLAKAASVDELNKIASDIDVEFEKLRATNPLFNVAVEHKMMEKMAAEIDALAAENGMTPEDAAAALDAATANDPEAAAELQGEAEGEALSDLAGAEQEQAAFMDGLDQTAAQVSDMLGTEVTADDIIQSVNDVVEYADQLGVEPEVLLQAALEEMTGGAGGEEPSEEDMAQAQQILDAAAAEGISPEEVIEAVAGELEGGAAPEATPEAAPVEAPVEEEKAPEAPAAEEMPKEASYRNEVLTKLASTRRGANLLKVLEGK